MRRTSTSSMKFSLSSPDSRFFLPICILDLPVISPAFLILIYALWPRRSVIKTDISDTPSANTLELQLNKTKPCKTCVRDPQIESQSRCIDDSRMHILSSLLTHENVLACLRFSRWCFWNLIPCNMIDVYWVSEERTASIIRVER
jgi:hypothetical protein